MSNIFAAIGIAQLKKIDKIEKTRKAIVKYYLENLKDIKELSTLNFNYDEIRPAIREIQSPLWRGGNGPPGALQHDHPLDGRARPVERLVGRCLELDGLASPPAAVGGDEYLGARVLADRLRRGSHRRWQRSWRRRRGPPAPPSGRGSRWWCRR